MNKTGIVLALAAVITGAPVVATAQTLDAALKPLGFLLGKWKGGGEVKDTGGSARGVSVITAEADGHAILRQDRNQIVDKSGKPLPSFGQLMTIYDEGRVVKADYVDGEGHVIHYGPAVVVDGKSVAFTSIGVPTFRLRYEAEGADTLHVWFGLKPPGAPDFQPIAIGDLHRVK